MTQEDTEMQMIETLDTEGNKVRVNFPVSMSRDEIANVLKENRPPVNLKDIPLTELADDSTTNPSLFDTAVSYVLENEGGLSDNPNDRGGKTKFGISQRAFPDVDLDKLTEDKAVELYRENYWSDSYEQLVHPNLAVKVFDLAVNAGNKQANTILQRAINKVSSGDSRVSVDGIVGEQTVATVNQLNEEALLKAFVDEQKAFYKRIVKKNPSQKEFYEGWLNRAEKLPS